MQSFQITEVEGDLFKLAPEGASLAHCVSKDLRMGLGIATVFKKKFGQVDKLREQKKGVGEVAFIEDDGRSIFYLVSKLNYWGKPSYDSLRSCLVELKKLCQEKDVRQLAMPKIGCGLDKLEWKKVKEILIEIFQDTEIQIYMYYL